MGIVETIALSMGAAWASGINLYAALATLGILGATGNINLPPELAILATPVVIAAAGFMYFVEFFADKVPGVDTAWDSVHTFIRIPAGAVLAAGAVGDIGAGADQRLAGTLHQLGRLHRRGHRRHRRAVDGTPSSGDIPRPPGPLHRLDDLAAAQDLARHPQGLRLADPFVRRQARRGWRRNRGANVPGAGPGTTAAARRRNLTDHDTP